MKRERSIGKLIFYGLFLFLTMNCSLFQSLPSISSPTATELLTLTNTEEATLTEEATKTLSNTPSDKPFELIGIWKSDDMRAADNSWKIQYSIYIKFTKAKQYVFHGQDAFTSNQVKDEAELVYIDESTFIKKFIYIPDNPEYLGKYQKWTWQIVNGEVEFKIYNAEVSQEQAMKDNVINTIATAKRIE
jgi:hypothetical protein